MPTATDEELMIAVLKLRETKSGLTAAETHKELTANAGLNVELAQVKKACSKATKWAAKAPAFIAAATFEGAKYGYVYKAGKEGAGYYRDQSGAADISDVADNKENTSKKEAKAAKVLTDSMKSAETHMMEMHRKLRLALGDDETSAAIQTSDRGENFIKAVSERALECKLTYDAHVPRERLSADLATLEWMLLAEKAGTLTLPGDARASATAQVARLLKARESKTYLTDKSWVSECFVLEAAKDNTPYVPPSGIDYTKNSSVNNRTAGASVDREIAKAGMLAAAASGLELDDID